MSQADDDCGFLESEIQDELDEIIREDKIRGDYWEWQYPREYLLAVLSDEKRKQLQRELPDIL